MLIIIYCFITCFHSIAQYLQHPDLAFFSLEDIWPAEKLKGNVKSCEQIRIILLPYELEYGIQMIDTCFNRASWDEQGRLLSSDFGFPTHMWKKAAEKPLKYEYYEKDGFITINATNEQIGYRLIYSGEWRNQICFWYADSNLPDEPEDEIMNPGNRRPGKAFYEGSYRNDYSYKPYRLLHQWLYISHGEYFTDEFFYISQVEYYDKKGRVTAHNYERSYKGAAGIADKSYTYDRRGNIISITVKNSPHGDHTINYIRDKAGNILTKTIVDSKGNVTDERKYNYVFDDHGNWTSCEEWKGDILAVNTLRKIKYYN